MSDTLTYRQMGAVARSQTHALFAQTMGYVAVTAGLFALGAWAGHDLAGGVGIVAFIAVKWLLRYVQSHRFTVFAWYRIALGVVLIGLAADGIVS